MTGPGPSSGDRGSDRVYLDHAATTPMCAAAVEAMLPYLVDDFGNPSGAHEESRRARRALEDARDHLAALLGARPGEVVFTSGGTEADNLAVTGTMTSEDAGDGPSALVCSTIEHHAVLVTCEALAIRSGRDLRLVGVGKDGVIDLDGLALACSEEVGLVSVMTVNNEIGTIQPVGEMADIVRNGSPRAVVHTDAVQAVPWMDLASATGGADAVSISGHKFGGPKGVGALIVKDGVPLRPLFHGGGHERERRSGTHNLPGIVAMVAALEWTSANREVTGRRVEQLRDRLADGLIGSVAGTVETGERRCRVPGILHVRFAGVAAEALVVLLDAAGIAVSAGAACASGAVEPSHVLSALGLGAEEASSGIRFSLGPTSTEADVDRALVAVAGAVERLRD
ncbi:MAG: cysteine desulfurase family protein [Acidimicrobiales bacterium]